MSKLTHNKLKNVIRRTLQEGKYWDSFKGGWEHGLVGGIKNVFDIFGPGEDPREKLKEIIEVLESLTEHLKGQDDASDKVEAIEGCVAVLKELVEGVDDAEEESPEDPTEEAPGEEEGGDRPGQYRYGEREPEKIAEVLLARPKGMI